MTISLKHAFTSAKSDGTDATLVQPSNWNAEHTLTAASGVVLGRDTSGAGAVQELPIAVDSSGRVGVGTTNPAYGQLQVANAGAEGVEINAGVATGVVRFLVYDRTANAYKTLRLDGTALDFYTGGSARLLVDSSGHTKPGADNTYTCGTSGNRWSTVYAATSTINTSDARLKADVTDSDLGLEFVEALRPVSYRWIEGGQVEVEGPTETVEEPETNDVEITATVIVVENGQPVRRTITRIEKRPVYDALPVVDEDGKPVLNDDGSPLTHQVQRMRTVERPSRVLQAKPGTRVHYGLIAQEVKAALDAAGCADFAGWVLTDIADAQSTQALRYDQFIAPLIAAVKELSARVKALETA